MALDSAFSARNEVNLACGIRVILDDPKYLSIGTCFINLTSSRLSKFLIRIIHNSSGSRPTHEALGYAQAQAVVVLNGFDLSRWQYSVSCRARARKLMQVNDQVCII